MDAILMLGTALAGWGFAVFLTIQNRLDERQAQATHANELERKDELIKQLVDQVQLTSQNMPYYPTIGPFPTTAEPEQTYYGSPDGLLVLAENELTEALGELDRLGD
jgi:hypothetical protein